MEQFEPPPIGAPSDYGVDDDGDGLFEQLVVVIPVETPSARKYNWSLAVANAKGETISQSAKSGELEAGRNELSFEFEGPVLREFGAHGPYRLRQFRFSAYFGGGPPRLFLDEIGTTQPYRADQFQSRPVQLLAVFPIGGWRGTRVQVEIRGQETSFEKDRTEIEAGQGIAAEVERVVGSRPSNSKICDRARRSIWSAHRSRENWRRSLDTEAGLCRAAGRRRAGGLAVDDSPSPNGFGAWSDIQSIPIKMVVWMRCVSRPRSTCLKRASMI